MRTLAIASHLALKGASTSSSSWARNRPRSLQAVGVRFQDLGQGQGQGQDPSHYNASAPSHPPGVNLGGPPLELTPNTAQHTPPAKLAWLQHLCTCCSKLPLFLFQLCCPLEGNCTTCPAVLWSPCNKSVHCTSLHCPPPPPAPFSPSPATAQPTPGAGRTWVPVSARVLPQTAAASHPTPPSMPHTAAGTAPRQQPGAGVKHHAHRNDERVETAAGATMHSAT